MIFAAPIFLLGAAFALVVGALLVLGALGVTRAVKKFGDPPRIRALMTTDPSKRRAWKGVLLVLATAVAFVAAARPQYGKGTRLVPATNVDVVVVLDYSKSMYAKDVEPSRIFRAKVEVARLIKDLEGARFGAVAFAGEPMGFPLTADGAAIAQFLRQLDPNDMPIGGTAIARALDQAHELLKRDPKAAEHKRIIVLVTDGEDLEGDPVSVARAIGLDGTTIHVVQIGGRTPERIPEVSDEGTVLGWRMDRNGKPLTTALTVQGEQQLAAIAAATPEGQVVRAEKGTTGIDKIAAELRRQMKSELAERVETVYADIYFYPLGLAILLLIAEVFLTDAPRRVLPFSPAAASLALGSAALEAPSRPTAAARLKKALGAGGRGSSFPKPAASLDDDSPWVKYPAPPRARKARGDTGADREDDTEAKAPSRDEARKEVRRGSK
ncbi:MAG: VWA domain-containing protein [Polyangiaceae bacterium]|nr:VWA domain-containing protein [Polyangiaceae bacterium]